MVQPRNPCGNDLARAWDDELQLNHPESLILAGCLASPELDTAETREEMTDSYAPDQGIQPEPKKQPKTRTESSGGVRP